MKNTQELAAIKSLRGTNLGVIRLSKLAYPREEDFTITMDGMEIKPIGYDTYGHPVISEEQFKLYNALKSIYERKNENFFVSVEYNAMPFCIRSELFDSVDGIANCLFKLKLLKEMLICRKQAAFSGRELNEFVIFNKYYLTKNGHVHMVDFMSFNTERINDENVENRPDMKDVVSVDDLNEIIIGKEVHIPNVGERCIICGKVLELEEVINADISENEKAEKGHLSCFEKFEETVNWERANEIVDSAYDNFTSEIQEEFFDEDDEIKPYKVYLYHTPDGDVSIRFKKKVIEIKWFGKFKPFDFESLFENERVTKKTEGEERVIHAWSKDKAVEYLLRVKNS